MSVEPKRMPRRAVERVAPEVTTRRKGLWDGLRRYAWDYPHKFFGYILFFGGLALSPLFAANLYVEAFQFREWVCPALPKPAAQRAGCPEHNPKTASKDTQPASPSLDPRAELMAKMGIAWNEENFWAAVKRGDARATELFLQGGMPINGVELHGVLMDELINKRVPLTILAKYAPERNSEFCESDDADNRKSVSEHRSLLRFSYYVREQRISKFVGDFCQNTSLNSQLQRRIDVEATVIADQERQAATNRKRRADCINRFGTKEYRMRWVELQSKRHFFNCDYSGAGDALEKSLCEYPFPRTPQSMFTEIAESDFYLGVRNFCANQFPVKAPDTATRTGLEMVLKRLNRQL